jgi:hypothetical protein
MLATNTRAPEIVLEAAIGAGLDPVVHVSSYVTLLPSHDVLGPDSPAGAGAPAYPGSKAESELIARRHQAEGAPVVTTYHRHENSFALVSSLEQRTVPRVSSLEQLSYGHASDPFRELAVLHRSHRRSDR